MANGLRMDLFAHSDYLAVQLWVCATYLYPGTINQMGP